MRPAETFQSDYQSRFIVGIDLGTTNCSLCYVDLAKEHPRLQMFDIPQVVDVGEVGGELMLPSFCYLPGEHELAPNALNLPWDHAPVHAVGKFAREQGARMPERLISSAKSWLAHAGVNRTQPILPWGGELGSQMVSPVDVSYFYLDHIAKAWNHAFGKLVDREGTPCLLADQQVIVTVPASFDETARELTIKAARKAGLKHLTLIEEPLAAFYSWLNQHENTWKDLVAPGDIIVVIDVGGGTTDFSLIEIDESYTLRRKAVGNHLLLGGDNIDMALAHQAETAWKTRLTQRQWTMLCQECRRAKEILLSDNAPEQVTIQLQGRGSSVLSGRKAHTFTRQEVCDTILNGFFADIPVDAPPPERRKGIQEMGLPYAADPTVTRHLLQFLRNAVNSLSHPVGDFARPNRVLFNGGAMIPPVIRKHVLNIIAKWCGSDTITELESYDFSLAVSRGGATYGLARRGQATRVKGGIANAYFLEFQAQNDRQLICVMPRDTDEGIVCTLDKPFSLQTNTLVAFPLHASSTRLGDKLGDIVHAAEDITELPPLCTTLVYGKHDEKVTLEVTLASRLNEVGTLEVWCQDIHSDHKYPLTFELRDASPETSSQHTITQDLTITEQAIQEALDYLHKSFASSNMDHASFSAVSNRLGLQRDQWPSTVLRRFADLLLDHIDWCSDNAHTTEWYNLLGFALRPGFGVIGDEDRIRRIWKLWHAGPIAKTPSLLTSWWVLWRRVAAGLSSGQQNQMAGIIAKALITSDGKTVIKKDDIVTIEQWRTLSVLEKIPARTKQKYLDALICGTGKLPDAGFWPIARIASRHLFAGTDDAIIPAAKLEPYLPKLLQKAQQSNCPPLALLAIAHAARLTEQRTLDISSLQRNTVRDFLTRNNAPESLLALLDTAESSHDDWQPAMLGDSLPLGLTLP